MPLAAVTQPAAALHEVVMYGGVTMWIGSQIYRPRKSRQMFSSEHLYRMLFDTHSSKLYLHQQVVKRHQHRC